MFKVTKSELHDKTNELCDRVTSTGEAVVIEDPDKPLVVLVSAEDYQILCRIEDIMDKDLIAQIKAEGGEPVAWSSLKAELGL